MFKKMQSQLVLHNNHHSSKIENLEAKMVFSWSDISFVVLQEEAHLSVTYLLCSRVVRLAEYTEALDGRLKHRMKPILVTFESEVLAILEESFWVEASQEEEEVVTIQEPPSDQSMNDVTCNFENLCKQEAIIVEAMEVETVNQTMQEVEKVAEVIEVVEKVVEVVPMEETTPQTTVELQTNEQITCIPDVVKPMWFNFMKPDTLKPKKRKRQIRMVT